MHTTAELEYWGNMFTQYHFRTRMKITFDNFMRLSQEQKDQRINHYFKPKKTQPTLRRTPCQN